MKEETKPQVAFGSAMLETLNCRSRAQKLHGTSLQVFEEMDIEVVTDLGLLTSEEDALRAGNRLMSSRGECLVLQLATFSLGDVLLNLISDFSRPIVLWSVPEPSMTGGPLQCGSFIGLNMYAAIMKKCQRQATYLHGAPEEKSLKDELLSAVRAMSALRALKRSRFGLFGFRVHGFYNLDFDELMLRNKIGPQVVHVDLSTLFEQAQAVKSEAVNRKAEEILKAGWANNISKELLRSSLYPYLAAKALIDEHKLDAVAIKCWPEIREVHKMGACLTNSLLLNEGIPAACEADVLGLTSMVIHRYLGGGRDVFLADLVSFDEQENKVLFWHCGAAPFCAARNPEEIKIVEYFLGPVGAASEFPLKPGRITVSRLTEEGGSYKMLIATGTAVDTEMVLKGTPVYAVMDCPVNDLKNAILDEGIDHHYAVAWGDRKSELMQFCKTLGIKIVTAKA